MKLTRSAAARSPACTRFRDGLGGFPSFLINLRALLSLEPRPPSLFPHTPFLPPKNTSPDPLVWRPVRAILILASYSSFEVLAPRITRRRVWRRGVCECAAEFVSHATGTSPAIRISCILDLVLRSRVSTRLATAAGLSGAIRLGRFICCDLAALASDQ